MLDRELDFVNSISEMKINVNDNNPVGRKSLGKEMDDIQKSVFNMFNIGREC